MNILLIYPKTPSTFWSFNEALSFVSKKSAEPPLGLITVAALLPPEWELKLIDMNVSSLNNEDIDWADYVFLSGMNIHIDSFRKIILRCNKLETKVIAGGPLATTQQKDFLGVDHFILNEAEITLPEFLKDLENGTPKHVYSSDEFPDISKSPPPRWDLLEMNEYASMSLQYSRGCPYDCEFCSITMLNGRNPRTKSKNQILNELNIIYDLGWRGSISIVDDNFIGNKVKLKKEILPAIIDWMKERKHPFFFVTEASINLADDEELMDLMVEAGFFNIFIGIETPNDESLIECGKNQNQQRDLLEAVQKLQRKSFIVSGGFIVGFDNDPPNIFDQQINFIRKSGITSAMIGVLNAPTGTKLFDRLKKEDRLLESWNGNNVDASINFVPKMSFSTLMRGYSKIIETIYSQEEYYLRMKQFLKSYKFPPWKSQKLTVAEIKAFLRLLFKLGLIEKGKKYFWKIFLFSLFKYPKKFSVAMTLAVYGYHFRKIAATI